MATRLSISEFDCILNSPSYVSNTVSGAGVYCGHNNFAGNGPIAKIKERNLFSF
jgi:hypothetical protein